VLAVVVDRHLHPSAQSSFQIGGVPVMTMNDASIMFVMWKRQKTIGTTP
jgi:hypothetical protein